MISYISQNSFQHSQITCLKFLHTAEQSRSRGRKASFKMRQSKSCTPRPKQITPAALHCGLSRLLWMEKIVLSTSSTIDFSTQMIETGKKLLLCYLYRLTLCWWPLLLKIAEEYLCTQLSTACYLFMDVFFFFIPHCFDQIPVWGGCVCPGELKINYEQTNVK